MALALYQVRIGYHVEWPMTTGREFSGGINVFFWIWVVVSVNIETEPYLQYWSVVQLLPVLYVLGLSFLRRQFRQERRARQWGEEKNYVDN